MQWLLLILSLPTRNGTVRQRAWRALKGVGAAPLRDGVYLMPCATEHRVPLDAVALQVTGGGGVAHLVTAQTEGDAPYQALFDRGREYAKLLADCRDLRNALPGTSPAEALKRTRKLRSAFESIAAIDFFPGAARHQVEGTLTEVEAACARLQAPDEPRFAAGAIKPLRSADFRGRTWATRCRPWVDRLASAWLIRRFIDPDARFLWLAHPADCPSEALGFDFDGATFSHVGHRVTFEVLAASFELDQGAFARVGQLVHFLDVAVRRRRKRRAWSACWPGCATPLPMTIDCWISPAPCSTVCWPVSAQTGAPLDRISPDRCANSAAGMCASPALAPVPQAFMSAR